MTNILGFGPHEWMAIKELNIMPKNWKESIEASTKEDLKAIQDPNKLDVRVSTEFDHVKQDINLDDEEMRKLAEDPTHDNSMSEDTKRIMRDLGTDRGRVAAVLGGVGKVQKNGVVATNLHEHDAAYFHAYSHIGVHEEMIKDRTRTDAYRDAIFMHTEAIRDKVVVDVGCGTGILSIFCAFAGARRVYAIDASDIAVQAQEVVKANGLSDIVTVMLGRVEEVEINEEVDVIVSEWMGYMLLYESMLPSVIYARDRWLKPGGIILPSQATLYMAPITNAERYAESIDFWRNVYGIDMSAMLPLAKQCAFEEPCVESITAENVLSWPIVVKHIDCNKVTIHELEVVTANFSATSMMMASLHGFAFWFDVTFGGQSSQEQEIQSEASLDSTSAIDHEKKSLSTPQMQGYETLTLSTAPEESPTHWQQTILYIYDPIEVVQDQVISGSISLSQTAENPRFLNIHLDYASEKWRCVKKSVMR